MIKRLDDDIELELLRPGDWVMAVRDTNEAFPHTIYGEYNAIVSETDGEVLRINNTLNLDFSIDPMKQSESIFLRSLDDINPKSRDPCTDINLSYFPDDISIYLIRK